MSTVDKGTRWVRQVQQWLIGLGFETTRSRWMDRGDDIEAGLRSLQLAVECKNHGRLSMAAAVDQAEANATDNRIAVVVAHRTGHTDVGHGYVVMSGHGFARLLEHVR